MGHPFKEFVAAAKDKFGIPAETECVLQWPTDDTTIEDEDDWFIFFFVNYLVFKIVNFKCKFSFRA